ncbi:exonuclease V [Aspergillus pseudodeflectus]|uniref:Exonuclease V n=1 Tax=Aspergillus pseudodeflectus TaxID=176178 RepID=A0ABR4JVW9_9EURO
MSCQPLPPSQRHDQSIVNNVDDSDYGSDFSADETELVNQLLAKADAPVPLPVVIPAPSGPFAPQQQLSPTRQIQTQVPAVIVRDIEDCDEDVSSGRKPRVLGKEKPPWQARRAGNGALSDARANKTGWIPVFGGAAIVEHPNSTEGREKQRERDAARGQDRTGDVKSAPDTRSPVERFRRPPNKAFSVTDLVSPAWCEVQYWYSLTKHGRKRRTPAMKRGSTMHKSLEDEIYTTVPIEITTKEDALALRIWNIIQGLRTLREFGITRELEIWGLVEGELVNGVIDQLSYECPDLELEASAASHYAEVAASRAVMPEYQMSLNDYLLAPAQGGETLADMSSHEVQPQAMEDPISSQSSSELQHLPRIYLTDIKTRASSSTPTVKSSSFRPTMLQLQLYYHMLNRLVLSDDVTVDLLASRYNLDAKKVFSDAFIAEVGSLNDRFFDALSSMEFDPDYIPTPEDAIRRHESSQESDDTEPRQWAPSGSQDSTSVLLAHNNLTTLWKLMKDQLRYTFIPQTLKSIAVAPSIPSEFQPPMLEAYPTILSPILTARYLSSAPNADLHSRVLGSRSFLFDPTSLDSYVSDQMNWWRGQRTPRGVEVMEAWKCRICEFQDECEWRQEREWAYARRKRGQTSLDAAA